MTYNHSKGTMTAWYAYNGLTTDQNNQNTRSFLPATHKAGLTERVFLDADWTLNVNYTFQDSIEYAPGFIAGLDTINRLDLTLSRKISRGKGEFMIGVADLLNETTAPVIEQGHFSGHETPGRMFFARVQLKF